MPPRRRTLTAVPAVLALLLFGGGGALSAGANHFTRTGGPDGGSVTLLALAPGRLWTATANSGLFTSGDGAATWTAVAGTIDDHAGSGLGADPDWAQTPIGASHVSGERTRMLSLDATRSMRFAMSTVIRPFFSTMTSSVIGSNPSGPRRPNRVTSRSLAPPAVGRA